MSRWGLHHLACEGVTPIDPRGALRFRYELPTSDRSYFCDRCRRSALRGAFRLVEVPDATRPDPRPARSG